MQDRSPPTCRNLLATHGRTIHSGHERRFPMSAVGPLITLIADICPFSIMVEKGHVWTAPAVQEESDLSAKRSGAAMYAACFSRRGLPRRDAAAVAAGPDVIR